MAASVQQLVDAVLAAVDCPAGPQLIATWASERYRELTNRCKFRHLLRFAEITIPAMLDDGTITATVGSDVIVGDATARAAWAALGDEALVDRAFRVDAERNWYRILGRTGANGDLQISSPYVTPFLNAVPAAGAAYKVVKRYHPLADDMRSIGILKHPRLYEPLEEISHQEMDLAMTSRVLVADVPKFWAPAESHPDGRMRVEVYPYPRTDQLIQYSYFAHAFELTLDNHLPNEIDLHILKAGVLVDVYRWEMSRSLREGKVDVAATWRNEMNTSVTRWEAKIKEAVKQDRASDTAQMQMMTQGFPTNGTRLVRNAYDYVWVRGNRP